MPTPTLPAIDLGRLLPPRARLGTYAAAILFTVAVAVADVAVVTNPEWLTALVRVADFLAPIVLGLAALNVPTGTIVSGSDATVLGSSHLDRERLRNAGDPEHP